jgi:phosphotransferase system HPr (HPr) family protein
MKTFRAIIHDPVGLHARPASRFVETANCFEADIQLCNLAAPEEWVNAKSILGVLTCAVKQDDEIEVKAEGTDEEAAAEALEALIRCEFRDAAEESAGDSVTT